MRSCRTRQKSKRPSLSPFAQRKAGTQRPLCRKTYNPVFVGEAREFGSHKDRRLTGFKTSSVRRASRLFPCNRASTEKKDPATDKTETSKLSSYYASLIRLPDDLSAAIDDGSRRSGRTRHFVLLTKTPTRDLQMCSNGTVQELSSNKTKPSTVKLTPTQSDSLYKFMNCPLYVYLHSACIPALWRSMNQKSSALLPCWTSKNTDWSIAWDAVEAFSSHNARAAFNRFIWNLAKLQMESLLSKNFSLEQLRDLNEKQNEGWISRNEILTDSFLNMAVLKEEGIESSEDAKKCRHYLSGCTSEVWKQLHLESMFQTSDEEGREPFYQSYMMQYWKQHKLKNKDDESSLSDWQLQDYGVTPFLAPWLVLLLCMPKYVVNAVYHTMALKWKEAFSIGDEISTSALAVTLMQWEDPDFDLTKMAAYGNSLFCIMVLLSKCPTHKQAIGNPFIDMSSDMIIQRTKNTYISDLIMQFSIIEETVWGTMFLFHNHLLAYNWLIKNKERSNDFSNIIEIANINANIMDQYIWSKNAFAGDAFVAFIGHYCMQHGVGAVWKICKETGVVKDDLESESFPGSEEWQENNPLKTRYMDQWQETVLNSEFDNSAQEEVVKDFANRLGYTFRSETFFELWIKMWTTQHFRDENILDWYISLGRVFMDQFFQSFMMQNYPDLSQAEINQIISEKAKRYLYIKLAFDTDLPLRKSRTIRLHQFSNYQDPETRTLYSFKDVDIYDIKSAGNVENHVNKSMLGMLGFVIFDGDCSIPKFNKLIKQLLAEDIKDIVANNGQIPESTSSNP